MTNEVKCRQVGNSSGVTFKKETLEAAGIKNGDALLVEVEAGKITLSKADSDHADAMGALDTCMGRYGKTLQALAK